MRHHMSRYYLSRVHTLGSLTKAMLVEAMLEPVRREYRERQYTFTRVKRFEIPDAAAPYNYFICGHLVRFSEDASLDTVDEEMPEEEEVLVPNLVEKRSSFVYVPEFSIIAFQSGGPFFSASQFHERFKYLIEEKFGGVLVDCDLEAIPNFRTFTKRLAGLDFVRNINAVVRPPNPLFGEFWKDLDKYLKRRQLKQASITENSSSPDTPIVSQLIKIFQLAVDTADRDLAFANAVAESSLVQPLDIGDAAVFMAADGYGHARVEGPRKGKSTVIRTSDTHRFFEASRELEAKELYEMARADAAAAADDSLLGRAP